MVVIPPRKGLTPAQVGMKLAWQSLRVLEKALKLPTQKWAVSRIDLPCRMGFKKKRLAMDYALQAAHKTGVAHCVKKLNGRSWKLVRWFDSHGEIGG